MKNLQLKNKSVLITGAGSGIGKAIALLFAREGADISFIQYNDEEDAKEAEKKIKDLGVRALSFCGDINDSHFCEDVVSKTASEFGGIDIVVNNAGTQIPAENISDLKEEDIRTTFNFQYYWDDSPHQSSVSIFETRKLDHQYNFCRSLSGT